MCMCNAHAVDGMKTCNLIAKIVKPIPAGVLENQDLLGGQIDPPL